MSRFLIPVPHRMEPSLCQLPWQDFLDCPAYVTNLDRRPDRWHSSTEQLAQAGFRRRIRWPAFDASQGDAAQELQHFGIRKLVNNDRFLEFPGAQGNAVSLLRLLQHIIAEGHRFAHIFEDDIQFSSQWLQLGPAYLKATPRNCELLYMGSQIEYGLLPIWHPARLLKRAKRLSRMSRKLWPSPLRILGDVLQGPLYCLHAISINRKGCISLLNYLLNHDNGFYIPDAMIHDGMTRQTHVTDFTLHWYAWNAARMNLLESERGVNPNWTQRNCGLIYQDESFGTDIQPR